MEEKTKIVCLNKACGKIFSKPLRTINLNQGSKEHYDACPNCLTEISYSESESKNHLKKTASLETLNIPKDVLSQKEEKTLACKYYLGYLSEKEHKQQILEECMICKELIECMHKK